MSFPDHFSGHAEEYARYRPDYPPALFDWLASLVERRDVAWDCATGNGQAALALAERFALVVATDASGAQLAAAPSHPRVRYLRAPAEASGLRDRSVDLVTVAQALHWFDLERFYAEARRVVVPGGVIAVWSYALMSITPAVDAVVNDFYRGTLADFWPAERRHVDMEYRTLRFPFAGIDAPAFHMEREWSLGALLGYIGTWSAVHRLRHARGEGEVTAFTERLVAAWGDGEGERRRLVRWPLAVRAGRIEDDQGGS